MLIEQAESGKAVYSLGRTGNGSTVFDRAHAEGSGLLNSLYSHLTSKPLSPLRGYNLGVFQVNFQARQINFG